MKKNPQKICLWEGISRFGFCVRSWQMDQRCWGGTAISLDCFCFSEPGRQMCWTKKVYLHFKKGRTKGWPLVNDLEEGKLCFFSTFSRMLVIERHDGLRQNKYSHFAVIRRIKTKKLHSWFLTHHVDFSPFSSHQATEFGSGPAGQDPSGPWRCFGTETCHLQI